MRDEIDLNGVAILNSPNVRDWPMTAEITRVVVEPNNVKFDFTKKDGADRWPDQILPGFEGPLQYTVWLFLKISELWHASGFIEMWQTRDGVGDGISDFPANWYYDAGRWSSMVGHTIAPGEVIGFMLTAGDARNVGNTNVRERSNVVTIAAPLDGNVHVFDLSDDADRPPSPKPGDTPAPQPLPTPDPTPAPPPASPPILSDALAQQLLEAVEKFVDVIDNLHEGLLAISNKLDALERDGVKVHL